MDGSLTQACRCVLWGFGTGTSPLQNTISCTTPTIFEDSNKNFGCGIIIWDKIFGTFSNGSHIERCGSGTGKQLSLFDQYMLMFYSNDRLKQL